VLQEKALGKLLCQEIEFFEPDVVISANTPLGTQNILLNKCRRKNIKFIFWVQDLLGVGIKTNLTKKLPMLGKIAGRYYIRLEKTLLRKSHEVVVITEDFLPIMAKAGVRNENVHVIENWAPIEEVPVFSKSNQWSREKGLDDKFCFLYSGTLGMKHNPDLLVKLAISFKRTLDVRIIVISEGLGAKHLEGKKREHCLGNLQIVITVQKDWNEYVPAE